MFLFLIPFVQSDASDLFWDHFGGSQPLQYVRNHEDVKLPVFFLIHKVTVWNRLSDQILKDKNVTLLKQNISSHTSVFCIFMFIKERRNVEKHDKWKKVETILLVLLPCTWVLVTVVYCFYRWLLETQSFLSANKHPQYHANDLDLL